MVKNQMGPARPSLKTSLKRLAIGMNCPGPDLTHKH